MCSSIDTGANTTKVFLSYSRRDTGDFADKLAVDLAAYGYDVWMDTRCIRAGFDWQEEIVDGLREADIVVALLSPYSVRVADDPMYPDGYDSVCLDEISYARFSHPPKPILPVMVKACDPPFCLFRLDYTDVRNWVESEEHYSTGFKEILECIEAGIHGKIRYCRWRSEMCSWDFDAFLYEKRRNFSGRQWLFKEIDDWCVTSNENALLIVGDPGIGKSAIAAQLVHLNPKDQLVAYHCCQPDTEATLQPSVFIRSLAAMLAKKIPGYASELNDPLVGLALSEESCIKDPSTSFERGILTPLQNLDIRDSGAKYILIDALDECMHVSYGQPTILDVLSSRLERLPEWLKMVATSRRHPEVLARLSGHRTRILDAHDVRNLEDLEEYITKRLQTPTLTDRLSSSDRSVDYVQHTLRAKSDGNFLYVQQALQNIERDIYSFERLNELPPGLNSLYRDFFARCFPDHSSLATLRPILEVIAAAQEPLSEQMLSDAIGAACEEELDETLWMLSPFLSRLREGEKCFITPYHRSLIDWFTNRRHCGPTYYVSRKRGHELLANLCLKDYDENGSGSSEYTLKHLVSHLVGSAKWEEIGRVLTDYQFVEAKIGARLLFDLVHDYNLAERGLPQKILSPVMAARFRDWRSFVCGNAHRWWRGEHPFFQSAYNFADAGQVRIEAEKRAATYVCPWARLSPTPEYIVRPANLQVLEAHYDRVHAVAVASDGSRAISGSDDRMLRMWDLSSGVCTGVIDSHAAAVHAVAVTPDGNIAISGSLDGLARVWDLTTRRCLHTLEGHTDWVQCVLATSQDRVVSGGADGDLRVWSLTSGKCLIVIHAHDGAVTGLAQAYRPGHMASCGSDGNVRIWNLHTGAMAASLQSDSELYALAQSTDGLSLFAAGAGGRIRVWDVETGQNLLSMEGHSSSVHALVYTPDRHLISGSRDGAILFWNASTGVCVRSLGCHIGGVTALALVPERQRVISTGGDNTLRIWDMLSDEHEVVRNSHTRPVTSIAITADTKCVVSTGLDSTIRKWRIDTGECLGTLRFHKRPVRALAVAPGDDVVVSGDGSGSAVIWNAHSGAEVSRFLDGSGGILAAAFNEDGSIIATGGRDGRLRLWTLQDQHCCRIMEGHTGCITALSWPNRQTLISVSEDRTMRAWDVQSGLCRSIMRSDEWHWSFVVWDDGRRAATGDCGGRIQMWDIDAGTCLLDLAGHTGGVTSLAVIREDYLVSGSLDKTLRTWDLSSGACIRILEGHTNRINAIAAPPRSSLVVSAGEDSTVRVWDVVAGSSLLCFSCDYPVSCCVVSPDGDLVVVGDRSGRIYCLHLENIKPN